jgi:hypothetical protein
LNQPAAHPSTIHICHWVTLGVAQKKQIEHATPSTPKFFSFFLIWAQWLDTLDEKKTSKVVRQKEENKSQIEATSAICRRNLKGAQYDKLEREQ